jgi:hypothetical protein
MEAYLEVTFNKRLPQDIANLLAICIRDLIWYKDSIFSFLRECGVPRSIMLEAERNKNEPTLRLIPQVLEQLYAKGDEGYEVVRKILTRIYYWKDIHTVPPDRKDSALKSLKQLQHAYKKFDAQESYERDKKSQKQREERLKFRKLDHQLLQNFRNRFDEIYFYDPIPRGNAYEQLLNDIFAYYFPDAFEGFNRTGEQLDGQFYFDGHWYYVEIRWRTDPASAADISILRDRARAGFAEDVRAVFVSFNGFTKDCLESLEARGERVILLTGHDFRSVLESEIALDVLLYRIQAFIVMRQVTYVPAKDVI